MKNGSTAKRFIKLVSWLIASSRHWNAIQLRSEAAGLYPDDCVDVRIVLGGAVEYFHCDGEFLEAIDISVDRSIHDLRQKAA